MWIKGKIFYNNEIIEACVNFDRKIKDIRKDCKPDILFPDSTVVFPGSIDMHVHTRGLELSYKETVVTATSEAAYGGVTTIIDMPNTKPVLNNSKAIVEKFREFENYSRTDYGVYSGVTTDQSVENLPIAGYKVFPEDLEKKEELQFVFNSNKLKILHPELPFSISQFRNLRSLWQELASIYLVKGNFHITHATNIETIKLAKSLGFTTDFTPHHLLVNGEKNCLSKVNPPIRDFTERRKLIEAIFEADTVVSDHAPHSTKEKSLPYELCPPGIAGISFTTSFIYSLAKKNIIDFKRATELLSKNPAKILGLSNYGEIKEKNIANFTVIDFSKSWRYHTKYSKVIETPLDYYPLDVSVCMTIIEGKIAFDGNEIYPIRGMNAIENSKSKL
ncbi:dihydroorotase [Acidianus sulfidivorans JP7]|uniref:Dihydroorotase n=1 Tax=Acidianus sulfidivorans JP7 TaxID=619593 RepID=A0A2U9INN6_9CREN|nr:dihydroorotase [Acidianus sulfidivorans]AWR97574.1 dihydroorotase [Acidianus sulfidivorans JP7]